MAESSDEESSSAGMTPHQLAVDRRRYGRLLQCPFCPEKMYSNYFKSHIFGYRELPAICGGSREKFPNGMPPEEYKRLQAYASGEAAFNKIPIEIRQRAASSSPPSFNTSPVIESSGPVSLPDSIGEMTKCGICGDDVLTPSCLFLPCCFRQQTCLFCLVRAGQHGNPIRCKACGLALVPPNNPGNKDVTNQHSIMPRKKRIYRKRKPATPLKDPKEEPEEPGEMTE